MKNKTYITDAKYDLMWKLNSKDRYQMRWWLPPRHQRSFGGGLKNSKQEWIATIGLILCGELR